MGLSELDHDIVKMLDNEVEKDIGHNSLKLQLIRHRLCELQMHGLILPDHLKTLSEFTQERQRGYQPLRLGSASLLAPLPYWRRDFVSFRVSNQVKVGQLIGASGQWGMRLADVAGLARPLAEAGFVTPDLDRLAAMPELEGRNRNLLSRDLDGVPPFLDEVDAAQLIRASLEGGIPLAEMVELARPLAEAGLVTADLDRLAAMPAINERQAVLLSSDLDGTMPFLSQVNAAQLIGASRTWDAPLAEVVELARPLAEVGLVTADLDRLAAMSALDERQVDLLSSDLDGTTPFLSRVNAAQLIGASRTWDASLAEVVEVARPLVELGLVTADLHRLAAMPEPNPRHADLLSRDLNGIAPFLDWVDTAQLIRASRKWGIPLAEIVELARPLAEAGLVTADLDRLAAMPQLEGPKLFLIAANLRADASIPELGLGGDIPLHNGRIVGAMLASATEHFISVAEIFSLSRDLKDAGLCNITLPDTGAFFDEKLLRLIAGAINWHEAPCTIDPLTIALLAHRVGCKITDLGPSLNVLANFDADCAEAIEFVQFCAERDRIEKPSRT